MRGRLPSRSRSYRLGNNATDGNAIRENCGGPPWLRRIARPDSDVARVSSVRMLLKLPKQKRLDD
jgi:hypothetical protein